MTERTRGDLCPGVFRPWPADDGALVRLRIPGGHVSRTTLGALLDVAEAYGDGEVHLTKRANLQLRALPLVDGAVPAEVVDAIRATGLLPHPDHELVRNILTATSRDGLSVEEFIKKSNEHDEALQKGFETTYAEKQTLDLFWRRQQQVTVDIWGEKTAAAFLGVRLECSQCHKHPFDRWSQTDYRAYANIFARVTSGNSPEAAKAIQAENQARRNNNQGRNANQIPQIREVFLGNANRALPDPVTTWRATKNGTRWRTMSVKGVSRRMR